MYVTMLGTGAPLPDPDRAQSGILVTLENGARYMFDCGNGTVRNMVAANANPAEVKAVFLTHLHHDHICDFPLFAIAGWMWDRPDPADRAGPQGHRAFLQDAVRGRRLRRRFPGAQRLPAQAAEPRRHAARRAGGRAGPRLRGRGRQDPLRLGRAHPARDQRVLRHPLRGGGQGGRVLGRHRALRCRRPPRPRRRRPDPRMHVPAILRRVPRARPASAPSPTPRRRISAGSPGTPASSCSSRPISDISSRPTR